MQKVLKAKVSLILSIVLVLVSICSEIKPSIGKNDS